MRQYLHRLKAQALHFEKRDRPIVIFGLRRGGSTMVSDAVAACRGVWFSNEPYAVLPAHPAYALKKSLLPDAEHSHFFCLRGYDLDRFAGYTSKLLHAQLSQVGTCWSPKFPLKADRICLKVLNAPWMLDWFEANTDAHIATVIRHPAAQALSVMRQGWAYPVEAYVKRSHDLEESFNPAQIDVLKTVLKEKDAWKTAIVDWIVTSHPLRHANNPRTLRLTYEDIVKSPEKFIQEVLVGEFGLRNVDTMRATLQTPSNSSRMSEASLTAAIAERDIDHMIHGWRGKLDERMREDGQRLLDLFEVSEYDFTT